MDDDDDISINVPRQFLGQAGEYLVAGKLLLNGFNVYKSAVDEGIDIVASKENTFLKVQVKTCQDIEGYDSGKYMASVNLDTLSKHNEHTTYLALVVHYLNARISVDLAGNHTFYDQDFLILPAKKVFEIAGKNHGKIVLNIKSTLTTDQHGEGYMYKTTVKGKDFVLDDYLIESFSRMVGIHDAVDDDGGS